MHLRRLLRRARVGETVPDRVPDIFPSQTKAGVQVDSVVVFDTFAISGTDATASVSIVGGEYKIEDGAWTSASGTIAPDQAVTVRHTSSASLSTNTVTTLTIGGVSATFTSTTEASDTTPDPFSFTEVTNATRSTAYQSNQVQLADMNASASFTAVGGTLVVNGSDLGSSGTCPANALIKAALTSSASYSTLARCIVTIGGVTAFFDVTTGADPSPAPSPTPSPSVTPPKAGAADYTVDFTTATTQALRAKAINDTMTVAYNKMVSDGQPKKIAIPSADVGSIFFADRVYPALLSVVPVDYANPPVFGRFANASSGLSNVVFDGLKVKYAAPAFSSPVVVFNNTNNITLSNMIIQCVDGSGNTVTGFGRNLAVTGGTNFTGYKLEIVGGGDQQVLIGQLQSVNPAPVHDGGRLINCSIRGGDTDHIRLWGATNFLLQGCYAGEGHRNGGTQHADCLQIAQVAQPYTGSTGTIDDCCFVQLTALDQTSGIIITDNVVPYTNLTFQNNVIVGCGTNSITARGVQSGLVIKNNKAYDTSYNGGTQAKYNIVTDCNGVDFEGNSGILFGDDVSCTYSTKEAVITTGMTLANDAARDAVLAAWKAAHTDTPFTLPNA